jgi:adenylate cyclase
LKVNLTTHLHVVPSIRMSAVITLLSHLPSGRDWRKCHLYFVVQENGWIANRSAHLNKREIPALDRNQIPVAQPVS